MTAPDPRDSLKPRLDGFALVLGASSGFGEACALSLAKAGMNIIGVHLDRRSTMPHVEEVQQQIRAHGVDAWFYNVNAADEGKRREVLDDVARRVAERGKDEKIRVLLHSLAFGTLLPFMPVGEQGTSVPPSEFASQKQLEMTIDVMANSLVYWTQDVFRRALFHEHARIFAMTSTGSWSIWPKYGVVSAAKAALESHIRVLAHELGPRGITANALCAGVTDTAALRKIPGNDAMIAAALRKNPSHRLTTVEDVSRAIVALSQPCLYWMNGNTINVDGGEAIAG
ncbi:MAG: SDR family oxidoreductase [Deltaproteobacteria bacterium]|nr:SDR family oxidoreductase [Deltaproteobacteria bacterium]